MALSNDAIAIHWDFENLHASLVDQKGGPGAYLASRFRPQDELVDISALMEFALSLGPIAINRAYANWVSFNRYKQALLQAAIELIQVFPPGANAKNGADIKLCLDVMDDMVRFPHIASIIVVGGDSDCMPLSYKVKAAGRRLVGIGSKRATNQHWARSCHEFKYYEALLAPPVSVPDAEARASEPIAAAVPATVDLPAAPASPTLPVDSAAPAETGSSLQQTEAPEVLDASFASPGDDVVITSSDKRQEARETFAKALARLAQGKGEPWVNKAGLRPYVQRMDPTFHESNYGFATFNELLASVSDLIEVRKGEFDHEVRLRAGVVATQET